MSVPFLLAYDWALRSEPYSFSPDDYVDTTPVVLALRHFLARYQGQFVLGIGDLALDFDFDPDLSTVFDELPDVLHQLVQPTSKEVELAFFEQGTDLSLWLARNQRDIGIRFVVGDYASAAFKALPVARASVPATMFLGAWCAFLRAVLAALVELEPALARETSYLSYRARVEQVAQSIV